MRFIAVIAAFTILMAFTTLGIIVRIVPIVLMSFPMTIKAGASVAAINATFVMVSFA